MSELLDLIIIGGGPAGMSAAIYAKRAGLKSFLLERSPITGGQVLYTYEVDNYPGIPGVDGAGLSDAFRNHAVSMDVDIRCEEVARIEPGQVKKVITDKNTYQTKAVIIATGASHKKLGVPGEEELTGMGVSYCATCDGAFFKGETVCVVGGGDVAVEDAIYLARACKKVYVIHRRDELRAADALQKRLFALENVEVLWDSQVVSVNGSDEVESVTIKNNKTGVQSNLEVYGVFMAVGISPNTAGFEHSLDMDQSGFIIAGEDCRTNEAGIYAVGDVRTKKLRQIITAAADGANAVTSVEEDIDD